MSDTRYRVLVVDDNQDSAETMGELLALDGFEVETCFDGREALAVVERFRPDACVLDINMPGMDGYELARRIREKFPDRPPVFATMTAHADYAHLAKAVDVGFDLQFTKPVDHREVAEQLGDSMRHGHAPEHAERRSALGKLLQRAYDALVSRGRPVGSA